MILVISLIVSLGLKLPSSCILYDAIQQSKHKLSNKIYNQLTGCYWSWIVVISSSYALGYICLDNSTSCVRIYSCGVLDADLTLFANCFTRIQHQQLYRQLYQAEVLQPHADI